MSDLITKTNAIKEYFVTENELKNLESIERKNPHNRYLKMKLYNMEDIYELLKSKYNTDDKEIINEKLNERRNKKEMRKKVINYGKQNKMMKRKLDLTNVLEKYGLEFREDSKLCNGYVNGTIKDKDLDWIANRMCQMKYLFEYCNMNEEIKK